jgi:glycosyltransferase involved in cell wall biosynthesis
MRATVRAPHVLIVVENCSFPSDRRVWLQASTLRAHGFDVTVISPWAEGVDELPHEVVDGIEVFRFQPPGETGTATSYAAGYLVAWTKVAHLALHVFRRHPFQVLQACNPPDTYFALAALLKPFGVRFLYDEHDPCPEVYAARFSRPRPALAAVLRWLERRSHRHADHVLTVNDSCRELLLGRTRTPAEQLTVVRSGADVQRLHRLPPEPELRAGRRFLCCYLGEMGPQDGVDVLLHALDVLVRERGRDDVHLALLGFGEQLDALRAMATDLGLDDYVTFTGRVESDTISRYFSTADLGLQPDAPSELADLCSMLKTIEYLSFGLPVVATDLRETRRMTEEAALFVDTPDARGFADAIAQLLDDEAARRRMSAVGQERAQGPLAWSHSAPVYVDVVRRLAEAAARAPASRPRVPGRAAAQATTG